MRVVALEEHFSHPALQDPESAARLRDNPRMRRIETDLADIGEQRLADMDAAGIDMQVLSHTVPGAEAPKPERAVRAAAEVNDALAATIAAHPSRFAGFATLPMQDPERAAAELERAVRDLGLCGTMINGMIDGAFLDDPRFLPVLERAHDLDVPVYLHPALPPESVAGAYYSGLQPEVGQLLAMAGWGWHAETAVHTLRLIVSGIFDRLPGLQLIIGHMGEMIPFALDRIDRVLGPVTPQLRQPIPDYFQTNIHITTSGYTAIAPLQCALSVLGVDRILFSVDYPYLSNRAARTLLDTAPLGTADREKIAHGNADRLLRL
ncbi:amidohydrolase family protein [Nocardia terpenica]|uniref:Amidohydrolase family protein n=1 Tax=Nocardia terpenica TaxID=455432 RepID=A0A6G9ZB92_9NOCA|nr:amidohydrolase family protein [Nocardia terpenica]QIS22617.1 amidohydrolase family protein [Nocardia terpenica]